jgi:hypothetical protein
LCNTSVKQQYLGQFAYASDNDGRFPQHYDATPEYVRTGGAKRGDVYSAYKDSGYFENSKILLCPLLAIDFKSNNFDKLNYYVTEYGAWDYDRGPYWRRAYPAPSMVYMFSSWFANYRCGNADTKVSFKFSDSYFGQVTEHPWPDKVSDCTAISAFIAHRITLGGSAYGFNVDRGHGGNDIVYMTGYDFYKSSKSIDNPIGYADGHIETRNRSEMRPRAKLPDGWVYYY